ncbi:unnamed protein product [Withania somnifera]
MRSFTILLFLATIVAVALASTSDNVGAIGQVVEIHRLRPQTGTAGYRIPQLDCLSWRLAVETNNLRYWKLVPGACENYVGHYMLGKQYRHDYEAVADAAIEYAEGLKLVGEGRDVWVFDIDETTLSNLPYYARTDVAFGAKPYNSTKFNAWVLEAKAPAIPAILRLYNTVLSLGIKPVILTGSREYTRQARIINLKSAGYTSWFKIFFKIVGNTGDQWSDIIGENPGTRTFKVPDPMYYVG